MSLGKALKHNFSDYRVDPMSVKVGEKGGVLYNTVKLPESEKLPSGPKLSVVADMSASFSAFPYH